MNQPEDPKGIEAIETISIPEAALAYLNAIEDSLSVLTSHIKNNELTKAEETIDLITTETTELRTLLLEEIADTEEL